MAQDQPAGGHDPDQQPTQPQQSPPPPGEYSPAPPVQYPPPPGQYAPPPGQYPLPPGYVVAPAPRTNGFSIASLVLGIVWIYWVGSILALVFGYIAKSQIDNSNGMQTGRGMAIAGIVLGWIGVGILILLIVLFIIGAAAVPWEDLETEGFE